MIYICCFHIMLSKDCSPRKKNWRRTQFYLYIIYIDMIWIYCIYGIIWLSINEHNYYIYYIYIRKHFLFAIVFFLFLKTRCSQIWRFIIIFPYEIVILWSKSNIVRHTQNIELVGHRYPIGKPSDTPKKWSGYCICYRCYVWLFKTHDIPWNPTNFFG